MEKDSKLNELIYVVGHRNPDTDSIVSAIAYAELKKKIGYTNIRAARAGILNFQTSYILNKLNVKPPVILNDIKTRVAEVMIRDIISIHNYEPLHNALVKFEKFGIRYLPVVDSEKKPEGLLTLSIVTNNLLKLFSSDKIITNINSICEVISGNLLNRCSDITKDEEFEIILTTGSINAFKKMISKNPDIPKIIITDDR
ncbi:MAG TPA: CBS domain-containing protein, partial [bacterium]|nr:CBS domain-containing protein [bacterium]